MKTENERVRELKIPYFMNTKKINKSLVWKILNQDEKLNIVVDAVKNFINFDKTRKKLKEKYGKYFDETRADYIVPDNTIYNSIYMEESDSNEEEPFTKYNNNVSIWEVLDGRYHELELRNHNNDTVLVFSYIGIDFSPIYQSNDIITCDFDDRIIDYRFDEDNPYPIPVELNFTAYAVIAEFEENDMILFPKYIKKYGKLILEYHPEMNSDIAAAIKLLLELDD